MVKLIKKLKNFVLNIKIKIFVFKTQAKEVHLLYWEIKDDDDDDYITKVSLFVPLMFFLLQ